MATDSGRSIRDLLNKALESEMTDQACEELRLPHHTTYELALVCGLIERALRGDTGAFHEIVSIVDPVISLEEFEADGLSTALEEFFAEITDRQETS